MMSLPAISFGDRFCKSRKGGTGGGGWEHPKGANCMAVSSLSFRDFSRHWVCLFSLMHEHLDTCETPNSGGEAFPQSG